MRIPTAVSLATVSVSLGLLSPSAHASEALAKKYACVACHQADKKLVGPAWKDIAAKYKGKLDADALAASIKKGSSGKWGAVPMPAQGHVPDADLGALATWILQSGS